MRSPRPGFSLGIVSGSCAFTYRSPRMWAWTCPRGSTSELKPLLTSREIWAARQQLLSGGDRKLRQSKPSELFWPAAVSRPGTCARLARVAPRVNSQRLSDVYRKNDPDKTARVLRRAAVLKFASSSHPGARARVEPCLLSDGRMLRTATSRQRAGAD